MVYPFFHLFFLLGDSIQAITQRIHHLISQTQLSIIEKLLVISYWKLEIGYWIYEIRYWLLVAR
jgi:hypothetical protein